MLIITLILATAMIVCWFIFLNMVTTEDWVEAAYNKVFDNIMKMEQLKIKSEIKQKKLSEYEGLVATLMKIFLIDNSDKIIAKMETQNNKLQNGDLSSVGILDMPGYAILRRFSFITDSNIYKTIMLNSIELFGKKHAKHKTKQVMVKLISYPIIGVATSLALGTLIIAVGDSMLGIAVITVGTALVLVTVYAIYDEIRDQLNKRRDAISRQFPNMISKLALLVTSGIIMDRAWRETAYSLDLELYKEMQKTAEELDNLVSPEAAYGGFIKRCNTKETTKLASAIIQNQSKGNKEIGILLREMGGEAWLERRHMAKRDSEKANSMLMIPTMLLFVAILIMIMVPIAINFSDL